MRAAISASFAIALIVACGGGGKQEVVNVPPSASSAPIASSTAVTPNAIPEEGTCSRSSVATGVACPSKIVPASKASSPEGCKSDADCKDSMNGRCIDTRSPSSVRYRPTPNLLGEPPRPPPRTRCEYDQCFKDADCDAKSHCVCDGYHHRSYCVPIDACTSDNDCGVNHQCECGSAQSVGAPNVCVMGNCRSDSDCHGGLPCEDSGEGRFCRTAADTCKHHEECKAPPGYVAFCGYTVGKTRWECRTQMMRPPG